jgi:hypothetical protein
MMVNLPGMGVDADVRRGRGQGVTGVGAFSDIGDLCLYWGGY